MEAKNSNTQIEIKLINAKHLWSFNFFQKLCVYAAVSLTSDADSHPPLTADLAQHHRTAADPDGDGHPEWNHTVVFNLPDLPSLSDLYLLVELRHHAGFFFPDRTIGQVRIPLPDLLEFSDGFRFADYQVRSPDGKPNGELWFAYKVNREKTLDSDCVSVSGYPKISDHDLYPPETTSYEHQAAYPAPEYEHRPPGMWGPPPHWGPPGFMGYGRPPPPPPAWGYGYGRSESQQYNGGYEQRGG